MAATWDASQLRTLKGKLDTAGPRVGAKVAQSTRKHGQELLQTIKDSSPVRTGELAGSWRLTTIGDGRSGAMSVAVRSDVRQAFFQEYGTSKMAAQPSAGPALDAVGPKYEADIERLLGEDFL